MRALMTGGLITAVSPDGIGAEVGLVPGDRLVAINGHVLRDVIDYHYYAAEEELMLEVERGGQVQRLLVEREYGRDLGLDFAAVVFDGLRECHNHCPFCFIAQMPPGLRRTLYVRDDDYRYSFLSASFVTLTDLDEADWQRIGEQHLSPLFVSIHATEPDVRRACLGQADAPDIVAQIRRLGELGITVHGQVVVVPGLNDGAHLERTIVDCAALWPTLQSLALVPVGLTRFHRGGLRPLTAEDAREVLAMAQRAREALAGAIDTTWLYPADELYLLAGEPVPPAAFYAAPEQRDNGVGLVRALLDDWAEAQRRLRRRSWWRRRRLRGHAVQSATLVCGASIGPQLRNLAAEVTAATGIAIDVRVVANRFFGETVTVSGLLTAQDLMAQLPASEAGEAILLPTAMLDAPAGRTLDDVTLAEIAAHYRRPVHTAGLLSEALAALGAR
ncbi:MAG: DUF512 domain-containing protein [Anaerolineales bacterium]